MHLRSNAVIGPKNAETKEKKCETVPAMNLFKGMPMIKGKESYEPLQGTDGENLKIRELIDQLKGLFEKALITDINGISNDRPQLELLRSISNEMELWVDAGSRYGDGVIDILVAGAEKVVLGTKTLRNLSELENAVDLSENIVLGIDYDDEIVSPKKDIREMSPLYLAEKAKSFGIEEVIFTDLKHLTSNTYFSIDVGSTLLNREMDVYFHGRFEGGVETLREMGLTGAMIEVETLL